MVLNKRGGYSLREATTDNKNDWRLTAYNGKEYFTYSIADKIGRISSEMPNYTVPSYTDYIAKIPQEINIPKFWGFYKDFLTDKSASLKMQGNTITLSFVAGMLITPSSLAFSSLSIVITGLPESVLKF